MSIDSLEAAALGAGLGEGLEIGGEVAIRVVAAAIKSALLFVYSLYQLTATPGTADPDLNLKGLGIFAVRVTTAG